MQFIAGLASLLKRASSESEALAEGPASRAEQSGQHTERLQAPHADAKGRSKKLRLSAPPTAGVAAPAEAFNLQARELLQCLHSTLTTA